MITNEKKDMNDNLFCALMCILPAIFFWSVVVTGGSPIYFAIVCLASAMYFTLSFLAYSAWYTNDCAQKVPVNLEK